MAKDEFRDAEFINARKLIEQVQAGQREADVAEVHRLPARLADDAKQTRRASFEEVLKMAQHKLQKPTLEDIR
jgi:hypothetical protein